MPPWGSGTEEPCSATGASGEAVAASGSAVINSPNVGEELSGDSDRVDHILVG